ncbi:MAG: iron-containing alcohol dehydrogenase [Oscillospiraceae bacterium]
MYYNSYMPTKIVFGDGSLNELHNQVFPGNKAMLVISNGKSTRDNGYLSRTEEQLALAGVEFFVFDKVEANPLKATIMNGGNFARKNNCDFIIALGGGSVMDAAKGMAIMATNDGDFWDYIQSGTGLGKPIVNNPIPVVAITTTAGTGSEADPVGVVTNPETKEKPVFAHPNCFPVISIVDPELMCSVPAEFTAYQGFDALFHSIEGYVANTANLITDMYTTTAIQAVSEYLARAVVDGSDLEARTKVAFGNTLSGIVIAIGALTSQHSLGHAMSGFHQNLPHGAGLIMISRAYFTHLIENHACDDRFVHLAKIMGNANAKEPMDFIKELQNLMIKCGVSDYGITPEEFEDMAENAISTMGGLFNFDRVKLNVTDCVNIYEKSYK